MKEKAHPTGVITTAVEHARRAVRERRDEDAEVLARAELDRTNGQSTGALIVLADSLHGLGRRQEWVAVIDQLRSIARELTDDADEIEAHLNIALFEHEKDEDAAAMRHAELALANSERIGDLRLTALACSWLADSYTRTEKQERAAAMLSRGAAVIDALHADDPCKLELLIDLAGSLRAAHRVSDAEAAFVQASSLARALPPTSPVHGRVLREQAWLRHERGDFKECARLLTSAVDTLSAALGDNYRAPAWAALDLADHLLNMSDFSSAEAALERARVVLERLNGVDDDRNFRLIRALAKLRHGQARYLEAERLYARAIGTATRLFGRDTITLAELLKEAGVVARDDNQLDKAHALYSEAVEILERRLGPDDIRVASAVSHLGGVLTRQKKYMEAEVLRRRSLERYRSLLGADHPWTTREKIGVAECISELGKTDEAEELLMEAIASAERSGAQLEDAAWALTELGALYLGREAWADAGSCLERAIASYERVLGVAHPTLVYPIRLLGTVRLATGRPHETEALWRRGMAIHDQRGEKPGAVLRDLAELLELMDRREEALKLRARDDAGRRERRVLS